MKTFIDHGFKPLDRVVINGVRHYDTGEATYPSVTTVTSLLSKDSIKQWRDRVGDEEANRVSARASLRGTEIHLLCENYLKFGIAEPSMFDAEMFNSLKPLLNRIDNIHALESPLYSRKLKVAGTVDCIAEFDGKLSIIDFKTSGKIKFKEDIEGYFLQTSAYGYMFWELTELIPTQTVIIMGVDNEKPLVFVEPITPWLPKFIDVRNQYEQLNGY